MRVLKYRNPLRVLPGGGGTKIVADFLCTEESSRAKRYAIGKTSSRYFTFINTILRSIVCTSVRRTLSVGEKVGKEFCSPLGGNSEGIMVACTAIQ